MDDLIIVNFKTYKESTGKNALKIVRAVEKAVSKKKGNVVLVPQVVDLRLIAENTGLSVFVQHVDVDDFGGHTGSINIDAVKEAGASGVLINHSEKRLSLWEIEKTVKLCKKKKMISVVCTKNLAESKKVFKFRPDYVAVEPPELIGGLISISDAKPHLIKSVVDAAGSIKVLCGAGINNEHDVSIAKKFGAKGVLIASGVIKSKSVYREILSLLKGFE